MCRDRGTCGRCQFWKLRVLLFQSFQSKGMKQIQGNRCTHREIETHRLEEARDRDRFIWGEKGQDTERERL